MVIPPVPPLWRTTDPETSKEAGRHMVSSGRLKKAQGDALRWVREHPGRTATELAHAVGVFDPRVLNRRLPELERLGLVKRGEPRPCRVTSRRAAVWWAA